MYTFTAGDLALARRLAKVRNDKPGIQSKKFSGHSEEATHYLGLLGEIAVARYLGLSVNEKRLLGGDKGVDLVYNKRTVDVKVRPRRGWQMLFNPDLSDCTADLCVLVWLIGERRAEIAGWTWGANVWLFAEPVEYRKGCPRWGIPNDLLSQPEELLLLGKDASRV
jgi:hypothetical protein